MTYEDFVLEYTKRDMGYHERYETTGIEFGRACWERAQRELADGRMAEIERLLSEINSLRRGRDVLQQQCSAMAEESMRYIQMLAGAGLLRE